MAKKQTSEPKPASAGSAAAASTVAGEYSCRGCGGEDFTDSGPSRLEEIAGVLSDGTKYTSITFQTVICNRCGQVGCAKRYEFDARAWGN